MLGVDPEGKAPYTGELLRGRLTRGAGLLLGGSLVSQLCAVAQGLLLARYLGVREYGILALVIAYPTLVNQFFDARSWETVVKYVTTFRASGALEKAGATLKAVLIGDLATGSLAFLIVVVSAVFVANQTVGEGNRAILMVFYSLSIPLAAPTGASVGLMRVAEKYSWISFLDGATSVTQLIGTVVVVAAGFGIVGVVASLVVVAALRSIAALVLATLAWREAGVGDWHGSKLSFLGEDFNRIFRFWVSTNGFAALKGFHQNADTLVLGHLLGPAGAGLYRLARAMANLISFPITPLYQATYPELTKLWHAGKPHDAFRLTRKLAIGTSLVLIMVIALVWAAAGFALDTLAGHEYLPAVPVFRLLIIAVGISVVAQYGHAILMAAGAVGRVLLAFGIPVFLQLGALILLVPSFGLIGAGIALLVFAISRAIILFLWSSSVAQEQHVPISVRATA